MKIFDRLREEVSIYDLFDLADPPVKYMTRAKPSQISCPFHGNDTHPSARVYPDDNFMRCFYCSESWDVTRFWAQINQWYRDDDKLDIKRAIDDLCQRYNINNNFSDWEKRFYSLKKQYEEAQDAGVAFEERERLASYYSWDISQLVMSLNAEQRKEHENVVLAAWDTFTAIDLLDENWQTDLICWYRSAKLDLHAKQL